MEKVKGINRKNSDVNTLIVGGAEGLHLTKLNFRINYMSPVDR